MSPRLLLNVDETKTPTEKRKMATLTVKDARNAVADAFDAWIKAKHPKNLWQRLSDAVDAYNATQGE